MSSSAQKPEIINRQELKTDAKWLKMEKINWKDQDGKEVSHCLQAAAVDADSSEGMGMCKSIHQIKSRC